MATVSQLMTADELLQLSFRIRSVSSLPVWVNDGVLDQFPGLVEYRDFATGSNARIDGKDLPAAKRRLKE